MVFKESHRGGECSDNQPGKSRRGAGAEITTGLKDTSGERESSCVLCYSYKDSPSQPSVAELAGRFKGHILPMPTSNNEPPFRKRPPCSLKLPPQRDNDNEDAQKTLSPNPLKVRTRNSALIEKLQANLALSPTALLPSPKSPDVKLPPAAPLSPTSPQSPRSPGLSPHSLRPPQLSSEEEDPVSFETPPEGTTLPSLHKTRARLSFKRRPPTRQHRRSAGEEDAASLSPRELSSPNENGLGDQVFDSPAPPEEDTVGPAPAAQEDVPERDRDCDTIEEESVKSNLEDTAVSEGRDLEEEQQEPCPVECEGSEMTEEAAQEENE